MKILITGGAGYIGTVLTKHLVKRLEVDKIIVFDNLSRKNFNLFIGERMISEEKVQFVNGDILDLRKLSILLKDIDLVYHLAARVTTPFANADADYYEQVNHWGTSELVSALEENKDARLIYLSSTSVYGSSEKLITEKSVPVPKTYYGISKLRGEKHVERLVNHGRACILRCANVYGFSRSMRFDALINRFMFDANFEKRIHINGNGKQIWAFIHVNILTRVLIDLMLKEVPKGIYNVVDRNLQIMEIVDVLKEIYPSLEFAFLNQHLNLRQLRVSTDSELRKHVDYDNNLTLMDELLDFKNRFSF